MIKVVLDIQGADRAPEELFPGVLRAVNTFEDLEVIVTGDAAQITPLAENHPRITIVDAPDLVTNHENPMDAFFKKPNASMFKGITMVQKEEELGAFCSCGATGALFTSAVMTLGRKQKRRPVLLCPGVKMSGQRFAIVDCGANVDCAAEDLVYFAKMGTAWMKSLGIENPKSALLSNGAEKGKGNALVKSAYTLLEESGLNFVGNTEGSEVLFNDVDVVVCEGFAGNVLMKTIEGTSRTVLRVLEEKAQGREGLDAAAVHAVCEEMIELTDYNDKGGALMLGLDKPVIKGHGGASQETIFHIVRIAYEAVKNDLTTFIKNEM